MGKPLLLAVVLSLLFLILSISSFSSNARSFPNAGGESEWMEGLMGMEEEKCEGGEMEEDCVTRRVVAEAHLDYIYTQKQPHH
ncbi:unnamed protein product [Linum tenue]|uniref:Phytosulfokine n=1 Tax=Linum tenue TaxID=586396 RepID=A0AAV0QHE0_9ROSI|nr:unnamed protein product [Linum tenue]